MQLQLKMGAKCLSENWIQTHYYMYSVHSMQWCALNRVYSAKCRCISSTGNITILTWCAHTEKVRAHSFAFIPNMYVHYSTYFVVRIEPVCWNVYRHLQLLGSHSQ